MRVVSLKVLSLSFVLLFVNVCSSEQAERENTLDLRERDDDGGNERDHTLAENEQTSVKQNGEDGLASRNPEKDGQSVRYRFFKASWPSAVAR